MAATLTPTTTASTQARRGGGRGDSAEEENDNMSSSSSLASTSFRSISSSSSLSSYTTTSTALTHKPHKSHQADWEAIRCLRAAAGRVSLDHFRIVRRLGSGDLGNVYLCRLREPRLSASLYAMKVVDRDSLAARKKLQRAETEREILSVLDHPFLPTLYAHFDAAHYSCIVMEFCPGGDLHVARQRQPSRRFSLSSTRFYASEILVALEYLHMMGVVYRDLKPENVLVRGDGHIMLSDFDLSLKCDVVPKLLKPPDKSSNHKACSSSSSSSCSVTAHGQPVLSCFLGTGSRGSCRIIRMKSRTRTRTITMTANESNPTQKPVASKKEEKEEEDDALEGELLKEEPELVAEPIQARSKSFVGTHEYLAPEVISGLGHGSAVDWWTLGVFMYELLFGRTPFKGDDNERTLINIIKQPLRFPKVTVASGGDVEGMVWAQDLISKLLVKNPKRRIGSVRGAVEIKRHEFFKGVNWALIRSVRPPEVPNDGLYRREFISKLINGCDPDNGHHFDYF